jgi:hypothetical protein
MQTVHDYVGFCGPMALRVLLHEYRCEIDPSNCKLPSVLNLVKISKVLGVKASQGEDQDKASKVFMEKLSEGVKIQNEECVPITNFFRPYEGDLSSYDWGQLSMFYKLRAVGIEIPVTKEPIKDNWMKIQMGLNLAPKDNFLDVLEGKISKKLDDFLLNSHCKEIPVPPFTLRAAKFSKENLLKELKAGRKALVNLVIPQSGTGKKGPHAIAVVNSQKTCCSGLCSTRYQTVDSLGTYWAPQNKGNDWVTESELLDAVDRSSIITTFEKPAPKNSSLNSAVAPAGISKEPAQ